ncbi:alpha/beta-hydrolase [Gloeophyllum trabeum ATCC 11539]|uniref:triacylglycerol lipase n=1 Tax=Gloeophyllum trabeum (strain ATCC 11539 / FP-39264 / Madison 617) TaxID=670483 RepID=S7QFU5_GLOTA|nr:alpha/beta-hydrolase [Gloeophyllum trabeum ATCC 11539]EPQ58013.1 alpha/beta-hydrolase [Gloeophyllum trabeum ATCC 11539]
MRLGSVSLILAALTSISAQAASQVIFGLHREYGVAVDGEVDELQLRVYSPDLHVRPTYTISAHPTSVYRPRSQAAFESARLRSLRDAQDEKVLWDERKVLGPDITDRHTLAQLARMTGNAYSMPGWKNWYDIDPEWNNSFPIGWDPDSPGFRGHVFLSSDESIAILSIKGTTINGPTSKLDKFNDNLLFSCCCARVDISWVFSTVCGCYRCGWRCDESCLSEAVAQDSLFYSVGINLINNLTSMYPDSDIWLVGHSLGGALASLLGITFGFPAVAFESPGERLAANRLHLPLPTADSVVPWHAPVTHVYHTADPIPQGACTGPLSPCAQAGYALETRCHLGGSVVFDSVNKLGWGVDIRSHPIREVVRMLEIEGVDWAENGEVPAREKEEGCIDCYKWEFGDFDRLGDTSLPGSRCK